MAMPPIMMNLRWRDPVLNGRMDMVPDGISPGGELWRSIRLGGGATILGDISIGDFARIGAGSVVTRDVPGGCTAVGVPARLTNCPEGASAY